jgi:hypothetical protein
MVLRVPPVLLALAAIASPLFAQESRIASPQVETKRGGLQLGAGYAYRRFREVSFGTDNYSSQFPWPFLSTDFYQFISAGPASSPADRFYDDGFVSRGDPSLGYGPGTLYNNNAQLSGNTLTFHGREISGSELEVDVKSFSRWEDDDSSSGTPYVHLDYTFAWGAHAEAGLSLNLMFATIDANQHGTTFSKTQTFGEEIATVTDRYTLDPNGLADPEFRFASLTSNLPRRTATPRNELLQDTLANSVTQSLHLKVTTLSLGPTASYHFGPLATSFATGWAVNFVNWDSSYQEVLSESLPYSGKPLKLPLSAWSNRRSGSKMLSGIFLQGALDLEIHPGWSWSVFGRYDWDQPLKVAGGPGSFRVDLSGFSLGSAMTVHF